MPAMVQYIDMASDPVQKDHLRRQWSDAVERRTITCECGQIRALELAYRCLYCGAWFCVPCAESHFGMTLQQWKQKKRAERVQAFRAWKVTQTTSGK
ncbi:hypothetical protein [Opitutus terrae]|uniref:Uncharacterized protein n=1 Tax=Opitutus terrae (strain DSM 11246 / JCM 15787 / PB90-1) TaxID=452637 RepID=B1ZU95_OPITP|nr:hypothetical protein [Opitutus terrae]ACB76657.1 hypothetical protein Oter_3380 [Opitutus terrae PB90-1]